MQALSTPRKKRRRQADSLSTAQSVYEWMAIFFLSLSPFAGVLIFGANRLWSIAPLMITTFVGGVLMLLRPFFFASAQKIYLPKGWPVLVGFLAMGVLHVFLSPIAYEARMEWIRVLSYVLAFWGWCELGLYRERWKYLLGALLVLVSGICWYAIIQHAQGSNMVWLVDRTEFYGRRASGTYICPNHFAHLIAAVGAFCLALVFHSASGWWLRILAGYTFVVIIPPLVWSLSRSGVIGFLAGCGVVILALLWNGQRRLFYISLIVLPLLSGGLLFGLYSISPDFKERIDGAMPGTMDMSAAGRLDAWADTLDMISDQPIVGHGAGSYRWVFGQYQSFRMALWLRFAHNEYLHIAADYGLPGALLLLGFPVWLLFYILRSSFQAGASSRQKLMGIGLLGVLGTTMAHVLFDFIFHIYANTHVLAMVGGLTVSEVYRSHTKSPLKWTLKRHGVLYGVLILLCVMAAASCFQLLAGYGHRRWGEEDRDKLRLIEATEHFEKAAQIDSTDFAAWLGLGDVFRMRAAFARNPDQKKELIESAATSYTRAAMENPSDFAPVFALGTLYKKQGDLEEALKYYEKAANGNPYNGFYFHQLALLYITKGKLELAEESLLKALEVNPIQEGARAALDRVRNLKRKAQKNATL